MIIIITTATKTTNNNAFYHIHTLSRRRLSKNILEQQQQKLYPKKPWTLQKFLIFYSLNSRNEKKITSQEKKKLKQILNKIKKRNHFNIKNPISKL